MFHKCISLWSRPQRQHFRKKIPGFYAPYLGASHMKHYPVIPYERLDPSLLHYPVTSSTSGKKVNWLYDTPKSGYEPMKAYGENSIAVRGLPMGVTPEYMQERLRRYFSKFGPVTMCRALNHPLDPYQCEGTGYVTFREAASCESAMKSVIRLGSRKLGYKVLSLRLLATDDQVDGRERIASARSSNDLIVDLTERLYELMLAGGSWTIDSLGISAEDRSCLESKYESVSAYFEAVRGLFAVEDGTVFPRRLINVEAELSHLRLRLAQELDESLSVHWRVNAPTKALPEYTQRRVEMWDKKDPLPFDLQILSRDFRHRKIHDEKFLVEAKKRRERSHNRAQSRIRGIAARKGTPPTLQE